MRTVATLGVLVLGLLTRAQCVPKENQGCVHVIVTDPQGAVVVPATVTVTNDADKSAQSGKTDDYGVDLAAPLGWNRVEVVAPAFRRVESRVNVKSANMT